MKTYQAKELEARVKLRESLSDKGKKLIWNISRSYNRDNKTVFDFASQEYRPFYLTFSVNNQ